MKRRLITVLAVVALMISATAPTAFAGDMSNKDDNGWACGAEAALPAGHCISPGTAKNFEKIAEKGLTLQVLVFDGSGDFLTAESVTFKDADDRPCPNDPESTDGTYWEPFPEVALYVCHHQPG